MNLLPYSLATCKQTNLTSILKVFDHKGNNFLGGVDLDTLFVEKIVCPKIEKETQESNLWSKLISKENPVYNKLFFELLYKAEEAKKELSIKESSSIEIDFETYEKLHKKEQKQPVQQPKKEWILDRIETEIPNLLGARYYKWID